MIQEAWQIIPDCPSYQISNIGRVYSVRTDKFLVGSLANDHPKVNLIKRDGTKVTRSISHLVAESFVDRPQLPSHKTKRNQCNSVIHLDGNFRNLSADNLAWRPRWLAWQYTKQLTTPPREEFLNFPVLNLRTGIAYGSIVEAGVKLGLLFTEIWRSTFRHHGIFPYWDQFEIIEEIE